MCVFYTLYSAFISFYLDALKDSNENEKKAESEQDPSNDSEALVDGVEKLNETMEEDSALVKEPNEAAAKSKYHA